jgi:hypothetical protein
MRKLVLAGGLILGSLVLTVDSSHAGLTVDRCWRRCGPLVNVRPRSEAKRVLHNCYVLCQNRGYLICPGGILKDIRFGPACPRF